MLAKCYKKKKLHEPEAARGIKLTFDDHDTNTNNDSYDHGYGD